MPVAIQSVEGARLNSAHDVLTVRSNLCSVCPCWDSKAQRKTNRRLRFDSQVDMAFKWVVGLLHQLDGYPFADHGTNFVGSINHGRQSSVWGCHPEGLHQLRPALMHVGGAATKVWLQAKQVRLRAVGGPLPVGAGAFDLVGLLIILMGPHVVGQRPRQSVERNSLEPVAKICVAQYGFYVLIREHGLHDRTQLDALRGIWPREVLVGAEHAVGEAMVSVQNLDLLVDGLDVGGLS